MPNIKLNQNFHNSPRAKHEMSQTLQDFQSFKSRRDSDLLKTRPIYKKPLLKTHAETFMKQKIQKLEPVELQVQGSPFHQTSLAWHQQQHDS